MTDFPARLPASWRPVTRAPQPPVPVPVERRRQLLAGAVNWEVSRGGRVEMHSDYQAVLVFGRRPNHVLHLLLTLLTFGLWGLVWLVMAVTHREHRATVTVDEWGRLLRQPPALVT